MKKMYRFIQKAAILAFIGILPIALLGQKENKKSSYTPLEAPHWYVGCLLYTSDAADDLLCVDLGGRRIINKQNTYTIQL